MSVQFRAHHQPRPFAPPLASIFLGELEARVRDESAFTEGLHAEVGRVVVGQRQMIDRILIGLLCNGHVLLEGVPGLAKTLAVKTLAETIDAAFSRIQFTPDLLPADLTGTLIYNPQQGSFTTRRGPVFANLVLADEINRAPAKVQSALLEAMQERQVTIGTETHRLPTPFLVLATQNPVEQEGTYPLPEAQLDRFLLKIRVGYPTRDDEREIFDRMTTSRPPHAASVLALEQLIRARDLVEHIYVDPRVREYVLDLVFATRSPKQSGLPSLAPFIELGASPRATIALGQAARAHAFLNHRAFVTPEDIKSVAMDVLRHRVALTYAAEAEGLTSEAVVQQVLDQVEVP